MEIEQKETDCKCENSTGWTTIKCCNQCGKSIEPFWRVDSENKTQPTIGIKEKEVDRTLRDEIFDLKSEWEVCQSCNGDIRGICTDCYNTRRIPNQSQIQYQKEQITKLEAEIKALREAAQNLVTAIEQRSFFQEGYRNGSASISEVMAAGDVEVKAYEAMGKLLTKNEG